MDPEVAGSKPVTTPTVLSVTPDTSGNLRTQSLAPVALVAPGLRIGPRKPCRGRSIESVDRLFVASRNQVSLSSIVT